MVIFDAGGREGMVKCLAAPVWRFGEIEYCDAHGPTWAPMVELLQTEDWKAAMRTRQLDLFGEVSADVWRWERL